MPATFRQISRGFFCPLSFYYHIPSLIFNQCQTGLGMPIFLTEIEKEIQLYVIGLLMWQGETEWKWEREAGRRSMGASVCRVWYLAEVWVFWSESWQKLLFNLQHELHTSWSLPFSIIPYAEQTSALKTGQIWIMLILLSTSNKTCYKPLTRSFAYQPKFKYLCSYLNTIPAVSRILPRDKIWKCLLLSLVKS